MKQEDYDSYSDYFDRLKTLIKSCQCGTLENKLLLDKIIYFIKDIKLSATLWLNKNMSLEIAIQCKSKELSAIQLNNMTLKKDEEEENQFNKYKIKKSQRSQSATRSKDARVCLLRLRRIEVIK